MWIAPAILLGWAAASNSAAGGNKMILEGRKLYESHCADCHRLNGRGLPAKFPSLDQNALVIGRPEKLIDLVLNGRRGKWGQMPGWKGTLKDREIALVLSYIRQAWSNKGSVVTGEMVRKREN